MTRITDKAKLIDSLTTRAHPMGQMGHIVYVGTARAAKIWSDEHFDVLAVPDPRGKVFVPKGVTEPLPYVTFQIHPWDGRDDRPRWSLAHMTHPDERYFIVEGDTELDWDNTFVQYKCLPWIKTLATDVCLNAGEMFLRAQADYGKLVLQLCQALPLEATFVTSREEIFQAWMWAYGTAKRSPMGGTGLTVVPPPFERESPVMRAVYGILGRPVRLDMGKSYDPREFFTSSGHKSDIVTMPADLRPPGAGRGRGPLAEFLMDFDGDVADTSPGRTGVEPGIAATALMDHLAEIDKLFGIKAGVPRMEQLREVKRLAAIGRQFQDTLAEIEEYRDELEGQVADANPPGGFTHTFKPSSDGPFMTMTTVSEDGSTTRTDLSEHVSGVDLTLPTTTLGGIGVESTFGKVPDEPTEPVNVTTFRDIAERRTAWYDPKTGRTSYRPDDITKSID